MSQQNKYWDGIIQQYKASGLSRPAFCKENELSYNQFQYRWYQHNCAEKANANSAISQDSRALNDFESVTISIPSHQQEKETFVTGLVIHLPNKISCEVRIDSRSNDFTALLKQLVALC